MTGDAELMISTALWDALPADVKEGADSNALPIMVVAAYLELLSEGYGLSNEEEESLLERAQRPKPFLPLLSHYFGESGGPLDDPDRFRNRLYQALTEIANLPLTVESARALFKVAQIFWALSFEPDARPNLPFKGGQRIEVPQKTGAMLVQLAWIGSEGMEFDFARLKRSVRANRAKGLVPTSGRGLLRRGAEIAVLVARRVVQATVGDPPSLTNASIRQVPIKGGSTRSIVWSETSAMPLSEVPATPQEVRPLAEDEARNLLEVVDKLRFLSESLPVEHEAPLAKASLDLGLALGRSGDSEAAIRQLSNAAKISETLAALYPDELAHVVRLVIALLATASANLLREVPGSEELLGRAVSLSQDLSDQDDGYDDLAALSLTLQGFWFLQRGNVDGARKAITRAVKISTKVVGRDHAGSSSEFLLTSTLIGLAGVELVAGRVHDSQMAVAQCLALTERLYAANPQDWETRILRTGALQVASAVFDGLGHPTAGLSAANDAVSIARSLVREKPADPRAHYLLGAGLMSVGSCSLSLDRHADAVESMADAIDQFERLSGPEKVGTLGSLVRQAEAFHISALLVRGALLAHMERRSEAESSLLRVVAFLDGTELPEQQLQLRRAFETLSALYREAGRDSDAAHAEFRATQLPNQ